mmetsp:Transcript_504/g.1078  ORF Transcript_504/g.1078 Transcript_504/m.1078 type:complete len:734 (-) Transcript_504:15-2216(-)
MNIEMLSRWQSHIMPLHIFLLSVLALLTLSLPLKHPNLQTCFTTIPYPLDSPGMKQGLDSSRTVFLSCPTKLRTTYPHPINSPFRLLCAPIMSSKKTDTASSESEDNAVERSKEMLGLNNITNGALKAAAGVWRAASNLPGNLMSEIGKLANQSVGPGRSPESDDTPQSSFEPLAFVRKIHVPGSGSIAHFLSSPPTFNVSLPRLSLPPRAILLNWTGLPLRAAQSAMETWRSGAGMVGQRRGKVVVRTSRELAALLEQGVSASQMDIRGRSQPWRQNDNGELLPEDPADGRAVRADGRTEQLRHPVLEAIWERARSGSKPGQRRDAYRIALAIEGGGLRGSVTAGMASAVTHLGLADAFDMVLGSSAGSIIGSYLVGRAPAATTYGFFCNHLTTSRSKLNGSSWLDMGRLVDLFTPGGIMRSQNRSTAPIMVLDYPMKTLMQEILPVDWEVFKANDAVQPIKVIATGLFSEGPVVLGSQEGSFHDLASLCECVKASCMLPGVAGTEPPWLRGRSARPLSRKLEGRSRWLKREFVRSVWVQARDALSREVRRTAPRASTAEVLRKAFELINSGGTGAIKREELAAAMGDIGVSLNDSELDTMMAMADLDKNGVIDFNEFQALILSLQDSDRRQLWSGTQGGERSWRRGLTSPHDVEPLVDALIYEPVPYRSAIDLGCTHVLVLRSYPDGRLLPRSLLGLFERLIAPKCLDPFPEVKRHMQKGGHSVVYAQVIP